MDFIWVFLFLFAALLSSSQGLREAIWYKRPGHFAFAAWQLNYAICHTVNYKPDDYQAITIVVIVGLAHLIPWLLHKWGFDPEE